MTRRRAATPTVFRSFGCCDIQWSIRVRPAPPLAAAADPYVRRTRQTAATRSRNVHLVGQAGAARYSYRPVDIAPGPVLDESCELTLRILPGRSGEFGMWSIRYFQPGAN